MTQKPEHSRAFPDIEQYTDGASYCAIPGSRVSGADVVAENARLRAENERLRAEGWRPIETAPKGGGAAMMTDPSWVDPPRVILLFAGGEVAIGRWDYYYDEGGCGCTDGIAWVDPVSDELLALHYDAPIRWMPLPVPPTASHQPPASEGPAA
jgi:hypothetical protein